MGCMTDKKFTISRDAYELLSDDAFLVTLQGKGVDTSRELVFELHSDVVIISYKN